MSGDISGNRIRQIMDALPLAESVRLVGVFELGHWCQPANDRILALPLEERVSEARTPEGELAIVAPDTTEQRPRKYLAVAVGPGIWIKAGEGVDWGGDVGAVRMPMPCQAGDVFIAGPYVGERLELEDQVLALVKASDVLAVLDLAAYQRVHRD